MNLKCQNLSSNGSKLKFYRIPPATKAGRWPKNVKKGKFLFYWTKTSFNCLVTFVEHTSFKLPRQKQNITQNMLARVRANVPRWLFCLHRCITDKNNVILFNRKGVYTPGEGCNDTAIWINILIKCSLIQYYWFKVKISIYIGIFMICFYFEIPMACPSQVSGRVQS